MKCNRCGSEHVFLRSSGNNVGIYCADCGKWIKWATKDEIRVIEYKQAEIANNRTTSETDKLSRIKNIIKAYDEGCSSEFATINSIRRVVSE